MLRRCFTYYSVSAVAVRPNASLTYAPGYQPRGRVMLGQKYNRVADYNRFDSLKLLLDSLSRPIGRRQIRMQNDLNKYLEGFRQAGVDWHDLKAMDREARSQLLLHTLKMTPAEYLILQTALEARVCGVLTRGPRMSPDTYCTRRGYADHGWRCGVGDHVDRCYFEEKAPAPTSRDLLSVGPSNELRKRASNITALNDKMASEDSDDRVVEYLDPLNFSIAGRLHHDVHPRVWSRPHDPTFVIEPMGFEFHVHPHDPRASPQIVQASEEWKLHADVLTKVLWEQLEEHGVDRQTHQPLELAPGDIPRDDQTIAEMSSVFSSVDPETGVTVERRMTWQDDATGSPSSIPWFTPSPPREWSEDGVPLYIPYAPSIAIKSVFRMPAGASREARQSYLRQPLVALSLLVHPKACFYWPDEAKESVLREALQFASKMPYALPWTLYFRVDSAKRLRTEPTLALKKSELMTARGAFFNLERYVANYEDKVSAVNGGQPATPHHVVTTEVSAHEGGDDREEEGLPGPSDWR